MTEANNEKIILEPIHIELISTLIGNIQIPVPVIVLEDEDAFFEEDARYQDVESSFNEETNTYANPYVLKVTDLERVTGNLFSLTLQGEGVEYELLIPGQHVQVGMMMTTLIGMVGMFIVSDSEFGHLTTESDVQPTRVVSPAELPVHLFFPAPQENAEQFQKFTLELNEAPKELIESINSGENQVIGATSIPIDYDTMQKARAEIVEIISGLTRGEVDALLRLYKYINLINDVEAKLEQAQETNVMPSLARDEIEAIAFQRFIMRAFDETSPEKLIQSLAGEMEDGIPEFESLFAPQDADLIQELKAIMSTQTPEERLKNTNAQSPVEEKIEFLSLPTNKHALQGNLMLLSDKINTELLYSRDWNDFENSSEEEEEGSPEISGGEVTVLLAVLIAQRAALFARLVDSKEVDLSEQDVVFVRIMAALTLPYESLVSWGYTEGLKRLSAGKNPLLYQGVTNMIFSGRDDDDFTYIINSHLGHMFHTFGHAMLQENWSPESMRLALEDYPDMQAFVNNIFEAVANQSQEEGTQSCVVIDALVQTFARLNGQMEYKRFCAQLGDSIAVMAELNALKNVENGSDKTEMTRFIDSYLENYTREM